MVRPWPLSEPVNGAAAVPIGAKPEIPPGVAWVRHIGEFARPAATEKSVATK